jgi:hypothetical protein
MFQSPVLPALLRFLHTVLTKNPLANGKAGINTVIRLALADSNQRWRGVRRASHHAAGRCV